MDYKTSKNTRSKIKLATTFLLLISFYSQLEKVEAQTISSTSTVSVSAQVKDPNPIPPAGGGGGGGGGGGAITFGGDLLLSGRFAPNMSISVMESGALLQVIQTDGQGNFATKLPNLPQGYYQVKLTAYEANNRNFETSTLLSLFVTSRSETTFANIKFPPLFQSSRSSFLPGEAIPVTVKSSPFTQFEQFLDNMLIISSSTNERGIFNTSFKERLTLGKHEIKLRERSGTSTLPFGRIYSFDIALTKNEPKGNKDGAGCPVKGDFNGDCKVNIIDFSLLAYWHKKSGFLPKYDLNNDRKISIKDFSILSFYWTG